MINLAIKTMSLIEETLNKDQGASFRVNLGLVINHIKDAYQGEKNDFRSHLGASVIGKECARQIWYDWRWSKLPRFSGRMVRLFNRGHLEEARFIAILLAIGCKVYQQDAAGNQFRISDVGGHFSGSGDGVAIGIPDIPDNEPCLVEFKTHGEKSFLKLQKEGVRVSKFQHYIQMQIYLRKMNLLYGLYCAVNKNTDEIYMEIVLLDANLADQFLDRGRQIIMMRIVPERIPNASPGLFACRYCDNKDICFNNAPKEHNCRTCFNAQPQEDGTWICLSKERELTILFKDKFDKDCKENETLQLSKERQLTGCKSFYVPI